MAGSEFDKYFHLVCTFQPDNCYLGMVTDQLSAFCETIQIDAYLSRQFDWLLKPLTLKY